MLYYDVGNGSKDTCHLLFKITNWMILVGVVIAELIMLIRVWALWRRSRTVGAILIVAFVVSIIIAAVIFSKFIDKRLFLQLNTLASNLHGCFTIRQTPVYYQGYLLLMAYETLIAGLMLAKGAFYLRHGSSSYITRFYKDGVVYYAALLSECCSSIGECPDLWQFSSGFRDECWHPIVWQSWTSRYLHCTSKGTPLYTLCPNSTQSPKRLHSTPTLFLGIVS
ncbi:hypothetical protein PTI98_004523 [Pleurotus ostreatus]|nr:hypothetical protein PTI98_004523 [Pleurotus ostreatus]